MLISLAINRLPPPTPLGSRWLCSLKVWLGPFACQHQTHFLVVNEVVIHGAVLEHCDPHAVPVYLNLLLPCCGSSHPSHSVLLSFPSCCRILSSFVFTVLHRFSFPFFCPSTYIVFPLMFLIASPLVYCSSSSSSLCTWFFLDSSATPLPPLVYLQLRNHGDVPRLSQWSCYNWGSQFQGRWNKGFPVISHYCSQTSPPPRPHGAPPLP